MWTFTQLKNNWLSLVRLKSISCVSASTTETSFSVRYETIVLLFSFSLNNINYYLNKNSRPINYVKTKKHSYKPDDFNHLIHFQVERMNGTSYPLRPVDEDINKELLNSYKGERTGWYWYGPQKYLMASSYKDLCQKYFNFQVKSDDVWIVTFPRSGTTLTQEIVWLLTHNLDYETAKKINLWDRSPFLEFETLVHPETKHMFLNENIGNIANQNIINNICEPASDKLENMPSPRVIKSHLALSMLPTDIKVVKSKIIYVARNPKEVALSFYHLIRLWRTSDYIDNFQKFIEQFQKGLMFSGPYWEHIKEGWESKDDENVLFLFYEDMIKDMKAAIHKIANFLSVNITENEVESLAEFVDIKNFKRNAAVNFEKLREVGIWNKEEQAFIRQGTTRGDGNEYNDEILKQFNKWTEENAKKINIEFPSKN